MTELSLPLIGECRVRRGPTLPPSESTATLPLPSTLSHAENRSWGTRVASTSLRKSWPPPRPNPRLTRPASQLRPVLPHTLLTLARTPSADLGLRPDDAKYRQKYGELKKKLVQVEEVSLAASINQSPRENNEP